MVLKNRGETFVTRKVTRALSRIALGIQNELYMRNLSSKRDWGHAKDYVRTMYLILQQDQPDDYVIATGITTTIRNFISKTIKKIGINILFKGDGINETGEIVNVDEAIFAAAVGEFYLSAIRKKKLEKK